jgi:hypothetical protein
VIKADALAAGANVYSEIVAQDRRSSTSYGGDAVIGGIIAPWRTIRGEMAVFVVLSEPVSRLILGGNRESTGNFLYFRI